MIELTSKEVAMLVNQKVDELDRIVSNLDYTPILSKQKALPVITRIQELLELIPDPSEQQPLEVKF